jgi:hypothetical protein
MKKDVYSEYNTDDFVFIVLRKKILKSNHMSMKRVCSKSSKIEYSQVVDD